jgi:hypothetical protein
MQIRVIEYTIENLDDPKAEIRYRLITSLLNTKKFPGSLLAAEYHQRWEVENTIDEFKVHLGERKTHVRSQRPREVVQEIYGLLLGHWLRFWGLKLSLERFSSWLSPLTLVDVKLPSKHSLGRCRTLLISQMLNGKFCHPYSLKYCH